mmetsp:Transcript_29087/g.33334  ORF Transcript_29087/g.33334 Transcript_29087/m.33334 type:complete len:83 (+) Transcript_29087:25-273(+)
MPILCCCSRPRINIPMWQKCRCKDFIHPNHVYTFPMRYKFPVAVLILMVGSIVETTSDTTDIDGDQDSEGGGDFIETGNSGI